MTVGNRVNYLFGDEIQWNITTTGPQHAPCMTCVATYGEKKFEASSGSKKEARNDCCLVILAALEKGEITAPGNPKRAKATPKPVKRKVGSDLIENSVSVLNQLAQTHNLTVEYKSIEQISMENRSPVWVWSVTVDGKEYAGSGANKKIAKQNAAYVALSQRFNIHMDESSTFTSPDDPTEREPNASFEGIQTDCQRMGYHRWWPHARQLLCIHNTPNDLVYKDHQLVTVSIESFALQQKLCVVAPGAKKQRLVDPEIVLTKRPTVNQNPISRLMQLTQKAQKEAPVYTISEDPNDTSKNQCFTATVTIEDQKYTAQGMSKKAAKTAAATVALALAYNIHQPISAFDENGVQRGDIGNIPPTSLSVKVQTLVQEKYSEIAMSLPDQYKTRKVLAGCVITRGDDVESAELVAIAAGTKCISGGKMSDKGQALNDMHAEILVRRALKVYLYEQIMNVKENLPSILQKSNASNGKAYVLVEGVRFHMYISSPPCGDSRLFSMGDKEIKGATQYDRNPDRKSRGQLRVKIESGEGTIPVASQNINSIQTWDGVVAGERLLTMSCSDKLARWSVLGFQGSLLSQFMEPMYFSSYILGSLFHPEHNFRGIYGRIANLPVEILPPFHGHCPEVIGTVVQTVRNTMRSPTHAIIWHSRNDCTEVINTVTGRTPAHNPSLVCKRALFELYRSVSMCVREVEGTAIPSTYRDAKDACFDYQVTKKNLYEAMEKTMMGQWVKKPEEQEDFTYGPVFGC